MSYTRRGGTSSRAKGRRPPAGMRPSRNYLSNVLLPIDRSGYAIRRSIRSGGEQRMAACVRSMPIVAPQHRVGLTSNAGFGLARHNARRTTTAPAHRATEQVRQLGGWGSIWVGHGPATRWNRKRRAPPSPAGLALLAVRSAGVIIASVLIPAAPSGIVGGGWIVVARRRCWVGISGRVIIRVVWGR